MEIIKYAIHHEQAMNNINHSCTIDYDSCGCDDCSDYYCGDLCGSDCGDDCGDYYCGDLCDSDGCTNY